jgi:hypothetical protein
LRTAPTLLTSAALAALLAAPAAAQVKPHGYDNYGHLRSVPGLHVAGPLHRVFCGNGSLRACRAGLESSLLAAAAETPAQVYPAQGVCKAGDQMCSGSIQFRAINAITQLLIEWVNRPTFQQAGDLTGQAG